MNLLRLDDTSRDRLPFRKLLMRLLLPLDCVEDVDITGASSASSGLLSPNQRVVST